MQQIAPAESRKITVAILIFIFCCLLSSFRVLRDAPPPTGIHVDHLQQRSDQRFAALRTSALLPQQGVVGYIGDSSDPSDYYLAQYALAPLVVDHSPNHPLVVGNFTSSPPVPAPDRLQLVKDFGSGVLLFATKDAK